MDYEQARASTNKVIDFIERNYGREVTDLELNLLNWLSDDEVLEFAKCSLDGFDEELRNDLDLPTTVYVDYEDIGLSGDATEEEITEAIEGYLGDTYGWCVNGYYYEALDDGVEITDIDWDTDD